MLYEEQFWGLPHWAILRLCESGTCLNLAPAIPSGMPFIDFFKKKKKKKKGTLSPGQPASNAPSVAPVSSSPGDTPTTGSTVWHGVLSVLCIAKETLDSVPVPGLKGAIGGFLEVVNQLEAVDGVGDAIILEALKQYQREDAVSPELVQPIEALSRYVMPPQRFSGVESSNRSFSELIAIAMPLQSYCKKSTVYLWANRDKIQGDIRSAGEKVNNSVTAFQAAHLVATRLGVARIEALLNSELTNALETPERNEGSCPTLAQKS
ncbi:uncharacterized protein EI90DRAFT_3013691 [Cantharellus anzutake]|uniref:uncharacterized protein n=1 Tax=Cantharellus anzutake TaxID=1750568 RepID=UPI0019041B1C|nr:uncharacterized protein EI90DRAFT_3013691 [Cantharellus anzutake]KAF8337481.1 hypothetical protein EI90DRAFT_3013691 [Cantharellus anzutake]